MTKKLITLFALAAIYIGFHPLFEKLISDKIVLNLVDQFQTKWYSDLLVGVFCVVLFIRFIRLLIKSYKPAIVSLIVLITLSSFLFYYRFLDNTWSFYGSYFIEKLKYLDITFLIAGLECSLYLLSKIRLSKPKNNSIGFEVDEPALRDKLNRDGVAQKIAERIRNTENKVAMAVGVVGKWGTGKTSFLKLIENNFKGSDTIIVNFNPWNSANPEMIVSDFFQVFANELSKYDGALGDELNNYAKKLVDVDSNAISRLFNILSETISEKKSLEEKKDAINKSVGRIRKQIIVFIDDLDRLDSKEVVEVIRLIRNTASFNSTFFIVAYDRDYVLNAIKGITEYSEFYLEKIFQIEIPLPQYEFSRIKKQLSELLKTRIKIEKHKKIDDVIFGQNYYRGLYGTVMLIDDFILNLRDVSRFVNSFSLYYDLLQGEVLIEDLINIECIRLKYPSVYNLLYDKRDIIFTNSTQGRLENRIFYHLAQLYKTTETVLESIIQQDPQAFGIPKAVIKEIVTAVSRIFPLDNIGSPEDEYSRLSIRSPRGFSRYFSQRLMQGELSENEFSQFRKKSLSEFCKQIEQWVADGLRYELRHRLEVINSFDDKEDFEKIIAATLFFGNIPSNGSVGDYQGFDDHKLHNKIMDYQNEISNKFYNGDTSEYKKFLHSVLVPSQPNLWAQRSFIAYLIKTGRTELPLNHEELLKISIEELKLYLKSINSFSDFDWSYWHACTLTQEIPNGNGSFNIKKVKADTANELMRQFSIRCLESFLLTIIDQSSAEEKYYKVSGVVPIIYESYENFERFIKKQKVSSHPMLSEFKRFYKQYKAAGYKSIAFDFKTIEVINRWTSASSNSISRRKHIA